ncbi:MAG: hypothetical protein V3V13_09440 [Paracoccaceae bacterium]
MNNDNVRAADATDLNWVDLFAAVAGGPSSGHMSANWSMNA